MKNTIHIPELSLVLLIGASGSGKSTFARRFFKPTEIVSSDFCRALISDNENSLDVNEEAFDLLYTIISKRLKRGLLTVVDATNIRPEDRKKYIEIARQYHVLPCAIVLNLSEKICLEHNAKRIDRNLSKHVIINHLKQLRKNIGRLRQEGFRHVHEFKTLEELSNIQEIIRDKLWNNKKEELAPFDIIGDIHGCYDELCELLVSLGYKIEKENYEIIEQPVCQLDDTKRRLVFLGDLVDRGPNSPAVLKMVMNAVQKGIAFCVPGNHDVKLLKYLQGKNVQVKHGLAETIVQLEQETETFKNQIIAFIDSLVSHYVLDEGRLVVAHAGLKEIMQGRGSGAVREFCLYGETTGEIDEFGLPIRYDWSQEYKGKAMVVYGHTPVPDAQWLNNTIDIDTGCVFGGKLTALRYPEKELIDVKAAKTYCEPIRPLIDVQSENLQQVYDDVLDITELIGKKTIETKLLGNITIRENQAMAALEVMSRFAVNPKWLIYLPPTMSPSETSKIEELLEYPKEAFDYYKKNGITQVICEEKHMGSRAVLIICKDLEVVKNRFGIENEGIGICYTRTGRRFFNDLELEQQFLLKIQKELSISSFWEEFNTDWVCFDCELMPWSAKARTLLQNQYAAVGSASTHALAEVVRILKQTNNRDTNIQSLLTKYTEKEQMAKDYIKAYQQYCWEVISLEDYKIAPFHVLATEGKTYFDKNHLWHISAISKFCNGGLLIETPYKIINLEQEASQKEGISWWEELTTNGGEGMVVKPLDYVTISNNILLQPAIKVRGREYLRIIYGLEYTASENMVRLKSRNLQGKRSLALREFALGVEALDNFVSKQPLIKTHQKVFGILALETEPLDPRL